MNENFKKLFEEIQKDENLMEKFKDCKTAEEAYAVATAVADGYTMEEFKEIIAKIYYTVKNMNGELSDDDLNHVAGGLGIPIRDCENLYINIDKKFLDKFLGYCETTALL